MKSKRIDEIDKYVKKNNFVSIEELSEVFKISINTVRRDINQLVERGTIEKVYGGVKAIKDDIASFSLRSENLLEEKTKIAKLAASFINEDDVIFIDSGTTTIGILDHLPTDLKCTIISNSLDIIEKASRLPNTKIFVVGSIFRRQTRSFVNLSQEQTFTHLNINKAFMAATGVSLKSGITNSSQEEYWIKKEVIENTEQKFLLIDHSKFDKAALLTYSSFSNIDIVITDQAPEKKYQDFFNQEQIQCIH